MERLLVTGAHGFIGKAILDHLLLGDGEVHVTSHRDAAPNHNQRVLVHKTDLLDKDEAAKLIERVQPSRLLHLAWYVKHGRFWSATENLDWVSSTLHLIRCFAENGGKRFVFAGTCFEYGLNDIEPLREECSKLVPSTLYGTAKLSVNMLLEKYCKENGVSYACGRPFFIFGPHENRNRLVASVILSLLNGSVAKTSHGGQIRDFIFIEDLAEAFVRLLESDVNGSVNLGSGVGVRLVEIIMMIAEIIDRPELLRIGEIPVSSEEPATIIADISRLRNEVGFYPEYDLKKRLSETIEWWKNEVDD